MVIDIKTNKYNYNNQSGMYRHKILLRQRTVAQDELMQDIETYEDVGSFWAMVKTNKNNDSFIANQSTTEYTKRFVVRYNKTLDSFINSEHTSFEIVQKDIIYDVKEAINDNDLNETITIYARGRE